MIIETLQTIGMPVYSIPELNYVFIWNEGTTLNLFLEYGGELIQVDVKCFELENQNGELAYKFKYAHELAQRWADEIRQEQKGLIDEAIQEEKEKNEG